MGRPCVPLLLLVTLLSACADNGQRIADMKLESPAFAQGQTIPIEYTCEGEDVSPELRWSQAPSGTQSFALIVDDPDAPDPAKPKRTWVHWVLYDIPADVASLARANDPPSSARDGLNDWKRTGWGGPCPPIGEHRYFFKLYALDAVLGDLDQPTKAELEQAMAGHILAKGELMGVYRKQLGVQRP